jgi:pimeloyl-ACP methyl ester carboxylesterase
MDVPGGAVSRDAVIVIPGIMGSALVEVESGDTLWGLDEPGWLLNAWTSGTALRRLAVTDEERAGQVGRIRPAGLLRFPAFAPVLKGFEPYTELVAGIGRVLAHPDALCEFSYDWRLSVEYNAGELEKLVRWLLPRWRAHPEGSADAKVVLVAHSMGGLIARYFTQVLDGASDVRTMVTLGTPYYGAVKAAYILNSGRGAPVPLPRKRLRDLVRHMPGLYDLLPFYRCVDEGDTARRLEPADVADIGGDADLAAESLARHTELMAGEARSLRLLVGVEQPTMQSLSVDGGVVRALMHTCFTDKTGRITERRDLGGDGTVFRRAAAAFDLSPGTLPQSHGAVAATEEAIAYVRDVLTNDTAGPPLGPAAIGVDVPDVVSAAEPVTITVTGTEASGTSCRVVDTFTGRQVAWPPLLLQDGVVTATVELPEPGVYRVEVKGGGGSAVTQQVMTVSPADYVPAGADE